VTLLLTHADVQASVSMADAIVAMEEAFAEEGEGAALLPQRINMKAGNGWLRVGPVVLEKLGLTGFKAMNLAPGHGLRYQVHLYRIETGELLSIMDAQHLTTLRTGATSAVATGAGGPARLGRRSARTTRGHAGRRLRSQRTRLQSDRGQPRAACS